jgi:soluble lytic murein transglycosylase-like protein
MSWRLGFALALVAGFATAGHAGVWQRTRPDGTVEYTNVTPKGGSWSSVKEAARMRAAGISRRAVASVAPAPSTASPGSTVWAREHDDGTMEFTNVAPLGARWKVLFRTGPGKAAATRGPSDLVPPTDGSSSRFSRYDEHIRDQQAFYGIPEALVRAVIKTESDFDPHVVSSVGAMGMMQLMPATAKLMGVTDVWDPRQNIMGGARYLQTLAKRFCRTPGGPHGGLVCSLEEKIKVLAGYHAGPGAVEKYGGMPPYETTRSYVTAVLGRYEEYRRRAAALSDLLSANP